MRIVKWVLAGGLVVGFCGVVCQGQGFRVIRGRPMMRVAPMPPGMEGQQVEMIVNTIQEDAGNAMELRDAAEDKLVVLGDGSIDAMKASMEQHSGLARDALEVALFRMGNGGLDPKALIADWETKRGSKPKTMEHLVAEGMARVFPNHLFFVVDEGKAGERSVIAVAADGKVQLLLDDAALAKFLRDELGDATETHARDNAARAALVLGMARLSDAGRPDVVETKETGDTMTATGMEGSESGTAVVGFDKDGTVKSVAVKTEKVATTIPSPPTDEPATTSAPAVP